MIEIKTAETEKDTFYTMEEVRKSFDFNNALYLDSNDALFVIVQMKECGVHTNAELVYVGRDWLTMSRSPAFPVRRAPEGTAITISNA